MTNPTAMEQLVRRADRLVRSLVGILDISWAWNRSGGLMHVDILKDEAVEDHQLVRNVVSGLGAGCGIKVERAAVRVHTDRAFFERLRSSVSADADASGAQGVRSTPADHAAPEEPVVSDAGSIGAAGGYGVSDAVHHAKNGNGHAHAGNGHANGYANGHGNGNGRTNGHGATHGKTRLPTGIARPLTGTVPDTVRQAPVAPSGEGKRNKVPAARSNPSERPAAPASGAPRPDSASDKRSSGSSRPALERIDLERRGTSLRCRVELSFRGHRYSAIAEIADGPTAEVEVAARVTLDALRGGSLTRARLDGVGSATIGNTTYVVVTLRAAESSVTRPCAAPIVDSIAAAAAAAVLDGVGPITAGVAKPVHAR
jgi:hypothetical protein